MAADRDQQERRGLVFPWSLEEIDRGGLRHDARRDGLQPLAFGGADLAPDVLLQHRPEDQRFEAHRASPEAVVIAFSMPRLYRIVDAAHPAVPPRARHGEACSTCARAANARLRARR